MSKVVEDSWLAFWHPKKKVSPARQNTLSVVNTFRVWGNQKKGINWLNDLALVRDLIEKIQKTCCTLLLAKPVTQSYTQIPVDWHISKFVQFFLSLKSLFCAELNQWSLKIDKLATNYISKWTSSASSLSGFQSQQSLSSTNLQFTFQHCVNSSIWTWSKTQMALKMLKKHQTL